MRKRLCLGLNKQFGISAEEQLKLFKKVGYDGAFCGWIGADGLRAVAQTMKNEGLIFQSVHSEFGGMRFLWEDNEEKAKAVLDDLKNCLRATIRREVPIMVMHAFIGFEDHTPNQMGIDRIGEVVKMAEGSGTKIAFENTEGIEYLDALMNAFKDNKAVGFCWDSGHEMCYNHSNDLLAKYGDRLLCTHLNDNLGVFGEEITWIDDLHLLPFDGIADWEYNTKRLKKTGFDGPLTFELNTKSKPDRHENDIYSEMPIEEYIKESFNRAKRIAKMME